MHAFQRGLAALKAARSGDYDTVRAFFEECHPDGATFTSPVSGASLLHLAAAGGHVDIVEFLLVHDVNAEARNNEGWCPLHCAAWTGHQAVIRLLVEAQCDVNIATRRSQDTPLHLAAYKNHTAVVESLLAAGAAKDAPKRNGDTPLHVARAHSHVSVVALLLEHGRDTNTVVSERLAAALHMAVCGCEERAAVDVVRHLIACGVHADADTRAWEMALHIAVSNNKASLVRALIKGGASIDALNARSEAPIHVACRLGHLDAAMALVDCGADFAFAMPVDGSTAMHVAAAHGHVHIMEWLYSCGGQAAVEWRDAVNNTPLHSAAHGDYATCAQWLVEHGASIRAVNKYHETPFRAAAHQAPGQPQGQVAAWLWRHVAFVLNSGPERSTRAMIYQLLVSTPYEATPSRTQLQQYERTSARGGVNDSSSHEEQLASASRSSPGLAPSPLPMVMGAEAPCPWSYAFEGARPGSALAAFDDCRALDTSTEEAQHDGRGAGPPALVAAAAPQDPVLTAGAPCAPAAAALAVATGDGAVADVEMARGLPAVPRAERADTTIDTARDGTRQQHKADADADSMSDVTYDTDDD